MPSTAALAYVGARVGFCHRLVRHRAVSRVAIFCHCPPVEGEWYESGWVYFCFAVEVLALFDALILYLAFLRTSDRSAEASCHEARLRAMPIGDLPSVDVYIPTFNEPMEVLEKTITGVLCLDYPNFKAWVLDDGGALG